MIESYPARYQDESGEEVTALLSDGKSLQMVVRGVRFIGNQLDDFEPVVTGDPDALNSFVIHYGCLCACTIEWEMPILVVVDECVNHGTLHARLDIGKPNPHKGGIDEESLQLTLDHDGKHFSSLGQKSWHDGWFDGELEKIKAQLPDGTYLKICHSCALGLYDASGYGMFGCIACCRNQKAKVHTAVYKTRDYWKLLDEATEYVQETYLCLEFERRKE